jgi:hypothetical protein
MNQLTDHALQGPPLRRRNDDCCGNQQQPYSVAPLFWGYVARAAPHPARCAAEDMRDTQPQASDQPE